MTDLGVQFNVIPHLLETQINMCEVPEPVVKRCSVKKVLLEILQIFTGKHLCESLFFNKVACLSLQLYQKRDFGTGVFL